MWFTEQEVLSAKFEEYYKDVCESKGYSMFDAGRDFVYLRNVFLNPFEVGTSTLCPEARNLFDLLNIKEYRELVNLKEKLLGDYKSLGLEKFTEFLGDKLVCTKFFKII